MNVIISFISCFMNTNLDSKQKYSSGVEERGSVWANNKLYHCYCHTSPQSTGLSEVIVIGLSHAVVYCNCDICYCYYHTSKK